MYKKEKLFVDEITIDPWYDPRCQETSLYVRGYDREQQKHYQYKLVKHYDIDQPTIEVEPTLTLDGYKSLPLLLQKLIDIGYEQYQLTPTKMKLENAAQTKHLNDMRTIVENQLNLEFSK
jgi:lipopolysaccharide export LptBFGC system permease protein LptF